MTHCVMAMLVAVLLQPPATPPAKPQPAPEVKLAAEFIRIAEEKQVEVVSRLAANQIEKWVANHPDIRVAEAKLLEAQAVLAQAKFKVGVELATNQAKLGQLRTELTIKKDLFQRAEEARKLGTIGVQEYAKILADLNTAKATLEPLEVISKSLQAASQVPDTVVRGNNDSVTRVFDVSEFTLAVSPSQPLRNLLDRKVTLAVKATDADNSVIGVLERCMKEWDFAAAKVIVRYPQASRAILKDAPSLQPVEGENTVGVWLLLMLDEFNNQTDSLSVPMRGKHQIYVREYGLLFTLVKNAPDGAPTLAEFLRQAKK